MEFILEIGMNMNDEFRFPMMFYIQSHSPEDFPAGFQSSNLIPCRSPAMQFVPKDCAEALHLRCRNIQTPSEILEES